jgi:hypothetical protein
MVAIVKKRLVYAKSISEVAENNNAGVSMCSHDFICSLIDWVSLNYQISIKLFPDNDFCVDKITYRNREDLWGNAVGIS